IALVVLVTSGRPILYRGDRVGRRGRFFQMLKFRTMKVGAEERIGQYLGTELIEATDAELTPLGRWLKASQLDEIPQLWNVLRGDMSFVGPRPIRPRFFAELAEELPGYWQRLVVRPGLTGLAQVRRGYETSMAEKLAHDLEWIADRSVRLYLRTLATTAVRVLRQFLGSVVPHPVFAHQLFEPSQRGLGCADPGSRILLLLRVIRLEAKHADQQRQREPLQDERAEDDAEGEEDDQVALRKGRPGIGAER